MLSHERVIQWMNVIRKTTGASQYRILENFWASQLNSKVWMVRNILKNLINFVYHVFLLFYLNKPIK